MTFTDKQIDLLMRAAVRKSAGATPDGHLDVDEMTAFAEGRVPDAARAHYVSHLAECDRCRRQVSNLAISVTSVMRAETVSESHQRRGFWESLSAIFSGRTLRYAAFAAVVVIVAGIAFITFRRSQEPTELVASSGQIEQHPASAVNPSSPAATSNREEKNPVAGKQQGSPSESTQANEPLKRTDTSVATNAPPSVQPVQPAKELAAAPQPEAKKKTESDATRVQPSYAPAPPGDVQSRQQGSVAGVFSNEQRKADQPTDKLSTTGRDRGFLKDDRDATNRVATAKPATVAKRSADENAKGGPSRNLDTNNRVANESNAGAMTVTEKTEDRKREEQSAQPRSVGGHKFRKQGNAWIDEKFKSSMSVKSIARGSDEFNALGSGLREIAQQLGGEVIVVWKGKAYLIK